jgi:hypothetical protein
MNGELKQISAATMECIVDQHLRLTEEERDVIIRIGQKSRPLFSGMFDRKLLCLVGLIPGSLLSDTAYIWCYHTDEVIRRPITFARHAVRLMTRLRQQYPKIIGDCLDEQSWRWLRSLGATPISHTQFEIA